MGNPAMTGRMRCECGKQLLSIVTLCGPKQPCPFEIGHEDDVKGNCLVTHGLVVLLAFQTLCVQTFAAQPTIEASVCQRAKAE
jgi:hypothetical protein